MFSLLADIRLDLRRWTPGTPLDTEIESDVFAPNTLAFLLTQYPELIIEPWDVQRVIDQLTDLIVAGAQSAGELIFVRRLTDAARGKARIRNQLAEGKLPALQNMVFIAEQELGLSAPNAVITEHLRVKRNIGGIKSFNVARARKALRDKGL